ncbi:MAG: hypothetical protein Fur0037_05450 [Planctomycetota bacterium]
MKLEPADLVAPDPPPPSIPGRRAFLWAAIGFAAGAAGGVAAGIEWFRPAGGAAAEDETLLWLRELAAPKNPIEDLIENADSYLFHLAAAYPQDELLWRGAARLGLTLISDSSIKDRRVRARLLAQIAQHHQRPEFDELFLEELLGIR